MESNRIGTKRNEANGIEAVDNGDDENERDKVNQKQSTKTYKNNTHTHTTSIVLTFNFPPAHIHTNTYTHFLLILSPLLFSVRLFCVQQTGQPFILSATNNVYYIN